LSTGQRKLRILVVDDDKLIRETVCRVLVAADYDVIEASEGEEAVRSLEDNDVEAVVVDIFMPKMDGLELIREIHRKWPNIRILAMSGGNQRINTDMLSAARTFGASTSLAKPFLASELVTTVKRMLSREG
jgi:DNA-binding response OmpR family regulator